MRGKILCFFDDLDDVLIEQFVPDGAITALDIGVLLRLFRLNVPNRNPPGCSPFQQVAADALRAAVNTNGSRSAAPFDDPVQAADDSLVRQREIHLDAKRLAVKAIEDISQPKRPGRVQAIDQTRFGASGTASASGLSRFNRLRGLILRFIWSAQ
jgi:hypothetical protein